MKSNFIPVILLLLIVFLFFFPVWTQKAGIFIDDVATYAYPNAVFQAKSLQEGVFPLWEPHTFMGAYPFYLRVDAAPFYPVQIITGLIGSLGTPTAAYRSLLLWPIIFHFLLAAVGAYLMGRLWLRLNGTGALVMGLVYSLSVSLLGGMLNPPVLYSQAWFPWLILPVVLYLKRGAKWCLPLGAVVIALYSPIWPIMTFHGFALMLVLTVLSLIQLKQRGDGRKALRRLAGLGVMLVVGILLSAPFWFSFFEGLGYTQTFFSIDYDFITAGPRSVPIPYWSSLFLPELFSSINFSHAWGLAVISRLWLCEAALTRGFWLFLPLVLGGIYFFRKKKDWGELRFWFFGGLVIMIAGMILMSGRYTPFFTGLYKICPFVHLPYASRWHTFFTFGLTLSIGIGTYLLSGPCRREVISSVLPFVIYGLLVLIAVVPVFLYYYLGPGEGPDLFWLVKGPGLYLLSSLFLLVVLACYRKSSVVALLMIMFLLGELIYFSGRLAYLPMGVTWETEQIPVTGPAASSLLNKGKLALKDKSKAGYRTGFFRSHYDNSALVENDYCFLGVATKPMLPRTMELLRKVCVGFPYQLTVADFSTHFPGNFSVRDWWLDQPDSPRKDWKADSQQKVDGLYHYIDITALPRIYLQDKWRSASSENQKKAILEEDLRMELLCSPEVAPNDSLSAETDLDRFDQPPKGNGILSASHTSSNRLRIRVEAAVPLWLVITDSWHPGWEATDNGCKVPIRMVNYCQMGIWLDKGEHNIIMEFQPVWWFLSLWLVGAGILGWLFLLFGPMIWIVKTGGKKGRYLNRTCS